MDKVDFEDIVVAILFIIFFIGITYTAFKSPPEQSMTVEHRPGVKGSSIVIQSGGSTVIQSGEDVNCTRNEAGCVTCIGEGTYQQVCGQ